MTNINNNVQFLILEVIRMSHLFLPQRTKECEKGFNTYQILAKAAHSRIFYFLSLLNEKKFYWTKKSSNLETISEKQV